jgi:hypothetical protein
MPARRWSIAVLFLAALTIGASPALACDPVWLPMARPDGISVFVALALADTVLEGAIAAAKARLHPGFGGRLDTAVGDTRGGQRVRLLKWETDSPQPREAVLVPWAYGPDCRPIAWGGRLRWMPEGARGAVTGWLRPREGWIGGLPTFDVEMAWREPVWAEAEPRWPEAGPGARRMTPEEFAELYAALPTEELLRRDPAAAAELMRRWARDHGELARLAPAGTMLGYVSRYAEGRRPSLAGRWTVELELLDSKNPALPVTARVTRGMLTLTATAEGPDSLPSSTAYSGTSAVDLTPLGIRLASAEVMAVNSADELRMILDPTVDHGHVVVRAVVGGDTMAGTWYLNSRPARASGRIRLRRVPS